MIAKKDNQETVRESSITKPDDNQIVDRNQEDDFVTGRVSDQSAKQVSNGLKDFLIQKSKENLRFAHLMFWCILSQMDDT